MEAGNPADGAGRLLFFTVNFKVKTFFLWCFKAVKLVKKYTYCKILEKTHVSTCSLMRPWAHAPFQVLAHILFTIMEHVVHMQFNLTQRNLSLYHFSKINNFFFCAPIKSNIIKSKNKVWASTKIFTLGWPPWVQGHKLSLHLKIGPYDSKLWIVLNSLKIFIVTLSCLKICKEWIERIFVKV